MAVEHATHEELLGQLQRYATKTGTRIGVDQVDGDYWRAGFIAKDELGEVAFVLHVVGPDETSAIRRLADLVVVRAAQRGSDERLDAWRAAPERCLCPDRPHPARPRRQAISRKRARS